MGVYSAAFYAEVSKDAVVPVAPGDGKEGACDESVELAARFLVGHPGDGLGFAVGEAGLDVVGGCVADEE